MISTSISDGKVDEKTARLNLLILFLAHATVGAQIGLYFVISGLAGQWLSENKCFSTLPITMIIIGSMISAPILARVTEKFNRKISFFLGILGGMFGCFICIIGLLHQSFPILLIGSFFHGLYMAAQAFYRFAAVDTISDTYKAHAISFVMIGGLFAAIIGPQTAKYTVYYFSEIPFAGSYLAAIIMNIIGALLFLFFKTPKKSVATKQNNYSGIKFSVLTDNNILTAIICALIAYALMNLVMTSTPLAVIGCGYTSSDAANIVTAHALSMYLPSFFTGFLISKYGVKTVMSVGVFLFVAAGAFGFLSPELSHFYADLIFLGVGWNFLFIGATFLLTSSSKEEDKNFIQGINDFCVFGTVAIASLASGFILNCSGTSPSIGWGLVNLTMIPFISFAAILIWFLRISPPKT